MKAFSYTITDALGIHARPAGLLAREAAAFPGTVITVAKDGHSARATQLMRLMSLGVKATIRVIDAFLMLLLLFSPLFCGDKHSQDNGYRRYNLCGKQKMVNHFSLSFSMLFSL